jgi:cobalamin biosynthesis Mg chelatase CobN
VLDPVVLFYSVHRNLSVEISFLHLLPYGFRAPPSRS